MLPVHDIDVPAPERRFHFHSGRVSLDLVATIGERWRGRFERLRTPDDLHRWLAAAGLSPDTPVRPRDLAAVRRLRGAVELLVIAAMAGRPYPPEAVEIVNATASTGAGLPRLVDGHASRAIGSAPAAAAVIARDAVDLFGSATARHVRECAADDCALVFLDTSRSHNRRWCSMSACGNRRKAARHRARTTDPAGTRDKEQTP